MTKRKRIITIAVISAIVCGGVAGGIYYLRERAKPYYHGPAEVIPGILYRGKDPSLYEENKIRSFGIKTVVNTRQEIENPQIFREGVARAKQAGAEYINIPIGEVLPRDEQIIRFLRIVRDGPHPILLHCQYGKSRTGILTAAHRIIVQEWSADKAMEEMIEFGYHNKSEKSGKHSERIGLLKRLENERKKWKEMLALAASAPS